MADDTTTATTATPDDAATADEGAPDLGDAGKKALDEERKARRAAERSTADLSARLKAFEDRDKTEAQRTVEALQAAQSEAAQSKLELARYRVAASKGLEASDAAFLIGSTEDEIAESADRLLARLGAVAPKPPSFDGGARRTADSPPDMNSLIRSSAGR